MSVAVVKKGGVCFSQCHTTAKLNLESAVVGRKVK